MHITLTPEEQTNLKKQVEVCCHVRHWKRHQALLLLAEAHGPGASCTSAQLQPSLCLQVGSGLENPREACSGRTAARKSTRFSRSPGTQSPRSLAAGGQSPTGGYAALNWTIPLLQTHLSKSGSLSSQKTLRRAFHQLWW